MGTARVWEGLRRFKKAFKPVGGNHDIAFLKEPAEEIRTRENPTLASHGIPTPTIHAYPPAERWFRNSCGSRWIEVDTSLAVVPAGWPMMAHHLVAPQASVDVVPPRGARTVGARRGGQQHGVLERHLARLPRQSTRSRYAMQLVSHCHATASLQRGDSPPASRKNRQGARSDASASGVYTYARRAAATQARSQPRAPAAPAPRGPHRSQQPYGATSRTYTGAYR